MNTETTPPALDINEVSTKQENAQSENLSQNQIIMERRAKLAAIREQGVAFPNDFVRHDYAGKLAAAHGDKSKEEARRSETSN